MKTRVLMVVVWFMLIVSPAFSQVSGFVESENIVKGGRIDPIVNILVGDKINKRVGWFAYSLSGKNYSEAYGGPTFFPTNWLELDLGVGVENSDRPFRYAGMILANKRRWGLISIHENSPQGGSGYWQMTIGKYQVSENSYVGFRYQTFHGVGLYLERKEGRFTGWAAAPVKDGVVATLIGLRYNFK